MSTLKSYILLLVLVGMSIGSWHCAGNQHAGPLVKIYTSKGDIEVELYPAKAPQSVAAFLSYVDSGYYTDASFYRVLSLYNQPMGTDAAELIQGGLWATHHRRDDLPGIPHEPTSQTGISHQDGTISLARQKPGTATTEFFICIGAQPGFDHGGSSNPDGQGYAAFGRVVKGMDVVKKIYDQPEENQYFDPPVKISKIVRL